MKVETVRLGTCDVSVVCYLSLLEWSCYIFAEDTSNFVFLFAFFLLLVSIYDIIIHRTIVWASNTVYDIFCQHLLNLVVKIWDLVCF